MAFLRIVCALLFLLVRLINFGFLEEFYCDTGSLPRRQLWLAGVAHADTFCVFSLSGSYLVVLALYLLALLAGLALLLGYRTRLATFVCWLMAFSLYERNPWINPASDTELIMCLFWGMFLPWGQCWSWDSRGQEPPVTTPYVSLATLAWRLQIFWIYVGAALAKTSAQWSDGTAVEVALFSDFWSRPWGHFLGDRLLETDGLLPRLTEGVVWVEFFLPWLLFVPHWRVQAAGLGLLSAMHLGFGLCLNLESFSPIAIGLLLGFLPARVWPQRFQMTAGRRVLTPIGPLASAFVTWAILAMCWSNAQFGHISSPAISSRAQFPLRQLGLYQGWYMFVPPPAKGGWHTFRGLTADGQWVNLVTGVSPEHLQVPERVDLTLPTTRHFLLYNARNRISSKLSPSHRSLAGLLRRRWESQHPEASRRLLRVELHRFEREYQPGRGFTPVKKTLIYSGLGT